MSRRTKPPKKYNHGFPLVEDKDFLNLSPRQRRYIYNYFLKPITKWTNARCYKDAYCHPKMRDCIAFTQAHKLMHTASVSKILRKLEQLELDQMGITANKLLLEETNIAYSDLAELFDDNGHLTISPKDLPPNIRKAISSFKVIVDSDGTTRYEYRLWNKGESLSRLEKIKGLGITERRELTGAGGAPIEINSNINHKIDLSNLPTDVLNTLDKIVTKYFPESIPDEVIEEDEEEYEED